MMGETQHAFATEDAGSGAQDKEVAFEPFGKKEVAEFDTKLLDAGTENGSGFVKEKEPHNQREAVIRPQQTGKIDFKSLQNRPRFPNEGPWGAVKGSPQSPTGKSRGKEKNRRSGKGDRGHQQLYRLTISSARPNPTIGIAYPQQKVTPPKQVEAAGRGGHLSGSYRFHVPSLPERDGELQQEELSFARGFADGPSSHISSNYTSPAKIQAPVGAPHENHGTNGHYLEFQGNGNSAWSSAEKGLPPGASGGVLPPKTCPFPDGGKASAHCLGPLSFQYPFQTLHSSAADPFQGEARAQDYVDVSVVSHGAFAFHSSSRDWKEEALGNGDGVALESRAYGLAAAPLPQFLPPQTHGPLPGYKGRHEHSTDHNGAISPSGAIDPNPSTFPENPAIFPPSLHISSMPKPLGTRQPLSKDSVASPRILDPGSALRRNTPHVSPPQVHFQNKAYGDPAANGVASLPFDKSLPTALQAHPRLLQPWEGVKKTYSSVEPSSTVYLSSAGSPLAFGCHEPRLKKTWQHLHLTSATPSQNRIELSRKLASQKLPFPTLEWDGKGQKSPADYASKALQSGEGAVIPRHDLLPQPCISANAFCFEGAKDNESPAVYGSRTTKSVFFGVSQGVPSSASSRLPAIPGLVLPPSALAASPSESPLPSPVPNATSGSSTCSSLSPTSSSPNSFEEGFTLNPSSFFHHQCGAKEGNKPFQALEPPSCGAFPFSPEASKDELLYKSVSAEGQFPKPSLEAFKGCLEAFEAELPPPPYSSSHHLLASSLSSASLDQLDVFLTCKQCDQNFSNLSSFLEHRQFCSSHAALHQSQAKDPSRGPEARKQYHGPPESLKHTQAGLGLLLPPDPHAQLLALNKGDDFLVDGEVKGDAKDDPLKGSQLNGIAPNPLPLSASDLEIDDAKLDSLITEALNGLGYQSDNPEIDSSFIDVFADEELAQGGAPSKTKEGFSLGQKAKQVEENGKTLSCYEDHPVGDPAKGRISGLQERSEAWLPVHGGENPELPSGRFVDPAKDNAEDVDAQLKIKRKTCSPSSVPMKPTAKAVPEVKQSKAQGSSPGREPRPAASSVTKQPKKPKLRSNTWSKELIHKIVEQKNKLHKLHTKSSKVAPLSCAPDRLLPETKDSKFVEYEYISESDEERVEYAKRHCRRKLGSRLKGRLRSSFSRKRQGRGGREKEKEPAWRCGLKRDWGEEPQKAASKEPGRAEASVGRARRRSSRSSSSSCQATSLTSLTSETSDSPQSTEKADSDTENEQQKRVLQNSKQRELLDVPEKEAIGRSRRMSIDLSRDLDSVDSAKLQLADVKAYQRDISALTLNGEDGLLQMPSSKAIHGKGSAMLFGLEATEQGIKGTSHDSHEPMQKDREQCRLQGAPRHPPLTACNGETLKYHTEEFLNPSSVGTQGLPNDENASYEQVDVKCLKKQKEFIASIGCFNSNSCDAGTVGKGGPKMLVDAAETFYGCKELPDSYESSGLFSPPPAAESSQNTNAYFCHGDIEFKQKHHEILPYQAENEEGKMSSPLSFDSSSVFVAEFDTTLYDGMASSKDSYVPFECKIDQHYPSFLHEKDWNLMEDISPVLPEEISPFHGLSVEKPIAKRYLGELHQTPLPERITDYNVVPFMSSISDDELEIKRLVTELESQLQTSKLHMEEAPGEGPEISKDHPGTERSEADHQFLPLTLDQESDGKGLFLMEDEFGSANLVPAKSCSCETSESEKALLSSLDGKYGSHENTWDHPVPFGPLHLAPSAPELILVEPLHSKGNRDKIHDDLKDGEICVGNGFQDLRDTSVQILPDSSLPGIGMEVPSYTSHLMQSPNTFFPKSLVTLPPRAEAFPELLPKEETFKGIAKLESYPVPGSKSESGLEVIDGQEAEGDLPSGVQSTEEPDETRPIFPTSNSPEMRDIAACFQNSQDDSVLPGKAMESENQSVCQSPAVPGKANNEESSPSEALARSKEANRKIEYAPALQEKAENPLQQLQLFVARTVKNNEEDLLAPCFSILHPNTHLLPSAYIQAKQKEEVQDNMQSEDVTASSMADKRKRSLGEAPQSVAKGSDPPELVLEQGKRMEHLGQRVSYATVKAVTQSPGCDFAEGERQQKEQRFEDECAEEGDINPCADGVSPEHNNLSPLGNRGVTSSLRDEGAQGGRVTVEVEENPEKATLAFRNHKSPGSLEKETAGCALTAVLTVRSPSWDKACSEGQGKTLQAESNGEEPPEGRLSTELPEFEDTCLQHGTEFCSGSTPVSAEGHGLKKKHASPLGNTCLDCFSSTAGLMDPKDLQRNNMGSMASNDFEMSPSEEVHSKIPACRYSSDAEKALAGDPMQREQNGVPPFTSEYYGATSPQALQPCHVKDTTLGSPGSQKGTTVPSVSSPSSIDLASLIETERAMELHMNDCKPSNVLPLKNKDLLCSEEVPKHKEDSETCPLRDAIIPSQASSQQVIAFGQAPSKVDSALPVDSWTKENTEFILKPQEEKEKETYAQADQTQPEVNKAERQEMSIAHVPETTNKNGGHFNDGQILETEENGSQSALRGIDNGGHGLEKEDCKQTENAEEPSGFVEQEKLKGGRLGETSKAGTETTKKGNGSAASCDICSVSFRSKTGLMRHKAVKHLSKTEDALLPAPVSLEKELKTSKKNRKLPIKEKACNSPTVKAAAGQPFPKSYRNQRRKPKRETQGVVVSKGLSDLKETASDTACELQNTGSPSKEREGEPVPRKEANAGEKEREARTDKLDSFSGKKVKGKTRKVKAKGVTNQKTLTRNSQLEIDIPALGSDVVPSTMDLILTVSTIKEDLGDRPISTEQSTSLPCPPRVKELEDVDERTSSAKETTEENLLQDVENTKEQAEDPDGKECVEESCPSGSTKESEEESSPCESTGGNELEVKENLLEEMMDRNPNSPLGCALKGPQQPCQVEATEKDFPKEASGAGAPCLEDPQPWRTEDFPPKNESQDRSSVGPDLFDDDFTFSQLFPRHDQFARRKCRRVYGKRIKKPKPVAEVATRPEGTADLFSIRMASDLGETSSFCVTREDPCEYDTIYIDDALMLNMCQSSKPMLGDVTSGSVKRMAGLGDEVTELENGGMLSLLCQKSPTSDLPSLGSWTSLEKKGDNVPADEASLNPSMELTDGHLTVGDSPEPPHLEEEPYENRIIENPCSPALHTIDMETPSTTFEMREVCFYSIGEDHHSCTDNKCTLGFKPASVLQGRPSKNKLEEGKQGKSRSDLNLKTKDKQYKCKVCFQWFLTLGELDFHKLSHNPSPPPTCYMCVQRKFSSREQLRDHLKEKHAKNKAGLWACGMCLKEISDVWMYNEHLREHATQFARKGQAQKSVLGLPDCFGEEDPAVAQFLNSIMCRKPSKASKNPEVQTCKERKGPKEPLGQEAAMVSKDSLEIPCRTKPPVASPKVPTAPSPDPAPKVEAAQKLAPMHPECKDPSRDCHHCGKQFPKPFKLQRHLVVHSLQKIYLCHKCPMFYQETKELRSHLSQEHGAAEEADIKHTTLYACELCADVMHVIKKSFICSTCNYTFSKKEQYDRHMEKHLVGSSRTFRFRGVMRPGALAKEGDKATKEQAPPKEEVPLAKKKRVGHHNSLPAPSPPLHCTQDLQLEGEPLLPLGPLSRHHSSTTSPPETSMKAEGLLGDFSNLLTETKKFLFDNLPPDTSLVPQDELSNPEGLGHVSSLSEGQQSKTATITDDLSPSFESSDAVCLDLTGLAQKKTAAAQKLSHLPEKCSKEPAEKATFNVEDAMGTWENLRGGGPSVSKKAMGFSPALETKKEPKTKCHISLNPSEAQPQESVIKPHLPEATFQALPLKDKTASPVQNQSPSKKVPLGENPSSLQCPLDEEDEGQKPPSSRDKATRDTSAAHSRDNCPSVGIKEAGNKAVRSEVGKPGHSDLGKCQERLAKLHPKKRKEHKAAYKAGSRENIESDGGKKKKARTQDNGGGDGDLKRPDWPNGEGLALTSRRGDAHCNKLSPKLKVSVAGGGQLKKTVLEPCFPKKANGDVKRKKDILGSKAFHPLLGKDPSGHHFHRQRAIQGAKLSDSHNYRTAESQNNLLSQLFGQKLTSFKIPLRRDPSE